MDGIWRKGLGSCLAVLVLGAVGAAEEAERTAPADDLPPGFHLLWSADSGRDYRWTLIGENEKADDQE